MDSHKITSRGPFSRAPSLGLPAPSHDAEGDQAKGIVPESVSASVCSQHKLLFFCPKQRKKVSFSVAMGVASIMCGKSPGYEGEEDQQETCRESKMQTGLGWEVCRAANPACTKGLILTRQAAHEALRVDSYALLWQALLLCSAFSGILSHFRLSYPKMIVP